MGKANKSKYIALASVVVAVIGGSSAYAATSCPATSASWGIGRVTSVIQDSAAFGSSSPLIGIEISYDSYSTKRYFVTSYNVQSDNRARTLLQLANLAYTTQAPVIPVTSNGDCAPTVTYGGVNYVGNWQGLIVGNAAKP